MASFTQIILDTIAPAGLDFAINGGAQYATNANVTLAISTTDPDTAGYEIKAWGGITGAATEAAATWQTYAASIAKVLTTGDGLKTIYVKIRDKVGNESAAVSKTITLDTAVPVVTITSGPDESTISKVVGFDTSILSFSSDVAFVEYKVKVVPSNNSLEGVGTVIPVTGGSINTTGTGTFAADTPIQVTIKGADLEAASSGDGTKIVKVFVRTSAGTWSVA